MRATRRMLGSLVLLAVLGVATSSGVAWGLAAWLPNADCFRGQTSRRLTDAPPHENLVVESLERPGMVRRLWSVESVFDPSVRFTPSMPARVVIGTTRRSTGWACAEAVGEWGAVPRVAMRDPSMRDFGMDDARGWPFPCLWYHVSPVPSPDGPVKPTIWGGWPLTSGRLIFGWEVRALPLLPIWRGLAMNSVFYGLVWGVLIEVTSICRARDRRRRGLCPNCAYDLRHDWASGCPECGWGRDARRGATATRG